jgi:Na+/H+-translocating membrane pyrophosphatase
MAAQFHVFWTTKLMIWHLISEATSVVRDIVSCPRLITSTFLGSIVTGIMTGIMTASGGDSARTFSWRMFQY